MIITPKYWATNPNTNTNPSPMIRNGPYGVPCQFKVGLLCDKNKKEEICQETTSTFDRNDKIIELKHNTNHGDLIGVAMIGVDNSLILGYQVKLIIVKDGSSQVVDIFRRKPKAAAAAAAAAAEKKLKKK